MAMLYGREVTQKELMERIGDITQVAGAERVTLQSGRAGGTEAVYVKTGSGLCFTILPGRGMDISHASHNGRAFGFVSKTGVVAPQYFEPEEKNFLRNFYAGLVTTCGLNNIGVPCTDGGRSFGLHDRVHALPAEDLSIRQEWVGDEFVMEISGKMRQAEVFNEYLVLTRTYTVKLGENKITWRDEVKNHGFDTVPLMLLYHINFGFPLLDEGTRLILPPHTTRPRDAEAEKGVDQYDSFSGPVHGYAEQVFYHDVTPDSDGSVTMKLVNHQSFSVAVTYNKNQLPYLAEWKQVGQGDYTVGLEPGTYVPEGRANARARGHLLTIDPFETKQVDISIEVL